MAQKDRLRRQILQAPLLSQRTRRAALGILEELPGGECLCHGDFHPGNVMLDGSRELVIDWHDASCGNPAADVARTWLLLRTALWSHRMTRRIVVGLAGRWLFHGYFNRYQELVPGVREEFHRWRLPVVAARLSEGVAGVEGRLVRLADELAKPVG
jgi:aminoglycoside phosphotransferase (APT) family kinase protein